VKLLRLSCIAGVLAVLSAAAPGEASESAPLLPAAVDHHLHIQGPELTAELRRIAVRTPEVFKGIDPSMLNSRTGADALRVLDEAGIQQGVLLSVGYAFASPFAMTDKQDVARLTRLENEYNVAAALASGGRLKAFVGVNPLADGAVDELRYWAGRKGVTGMKMQLGNSGFDPRSSAHIAKLALLFDAARATGLSIVVHARSAEDYGCADAKRFIDEVLSHAGDLPVQVAHAGGYGGLDEATLAALSAYAAAIERNAAGTKNLVFDLAAVIIDDKTDTQRARRFVELVRGVGLSRFVMGSDWPGLYSPRKHNELTQSQLPLTAAEWRVILSNRAPYFTAASDNAHEKPARAERK
jgi:predicted TIM-barrel fold metal-dependent hydrolase